ncbi:hypothetical protein Acr_15g0012710 [Actinidia rufa]|uniref:Reverse transcriptase zinc-binding domain-containing protein n=1 Tax=Actinidia rufa TaxID=165716 RepID=A0A7J0FVD8_9ERIC|nr:hypothetical protein Acr_15g0012710 [Actinidia rufa]
MVEFNACVGDVDITSTGFIFTWSGGGGAIGDRKSKIDRAMINHKWQDCFPESQAVFAAPGVVRDLGNSLQANVSSIICEGDWKWPRQRNRLSCISWLTPLKTSSLMQPLVIKVFWFPANDGFYTVKSAWKSIRLPKPKVPWYATVSFKGQVPKWGFILWLCCLGRLATEDRLTVWGMGIWARVLNRVQVNRIPSGWSEELAWATENWINPGFGSCFFKLVLSAAVYHIWGERNARIFSSKARDVEAVFKTMKREVRDRCCSWDMVENSLSSWQLLAAVPLMEHSYQDFKIG